MNRSRLITLLVAVGIVVLGVAYGLNRGGDSSGGSSTTGDGGSTPAGAVVVDVAYSPEKEKLLEPLFDEFNRSGATVSGHPLRVRGQVVSSGDATDRIARDALHPAIWSPSSSFWGRILNRRADATLVADDNPSLVRTPLVIAMPEPMARALGWPKRALGWKDVLAAAQAPGGWAHYGHPEWGRFKFGQTNPDFSTSGLSATTAEYLVAAGKGEGLTIADVRSPKVRRFVRGIQDSVVHYGDTTLFFAQQLAAHGPTYVSAIAMEEVTLLDYNTRLREGGPKLVAIYPSEGTFYSDDPLIVPDGPWMTPDLRAGAKQVVAFLTGKVDAATAARFSFRPADANARPLAPVTAANGADPAKPARLLSLPDPQVLDAILKAWRADRKPARVEVVLDVSGSMGDDNKLEAAKRGLLGFLRFLQPQDEVGLTVFSDKVTVVQPPVPMRTGRQALARRIQGLAPDGGTAVYDATDQAAARIARAAGDDHISAVVVLTDGQDNESNLAVEDLAGRLRTLSGSEGRGVRVFTIAYGTGAEKDVLARIAEAGAGLPYVGDPDTIEKVYVQISSFF